MTSIGITSEVWFPVVTLIVGALLKGIFDFLSDGRTFKREQQARKEERQDSLRLKRVDFQRTTLLELQVSLSKQMRLLGRSHYLDVMAFRSSGKWGKSPLPEDVDQGINETQIAINQSRVRVRDVEVRSLCAEFSAAFEVTLMAGSQELQKIGVEATSQIQIKLLEKIGFVLRTLDDEEVTISE